MPPTPTPKSFLVDAAAEWWEQVKFVYYETKRFFMEDVELPAIVASILAGFVALAMLIPLVAAPVTLFILRKLATPIILRTIDGLDQVRHELTPSTNKLTTASLGEMFGTKFDDADLPTEGDEQAHQERAARIGDKVFKLLEKEFTRKGPLSGAQGEDAAKMFAGFNVNFATANATLAMLTEAVSFGQFENARELGSEIARGLGLGRMSRTGISELVSILVSTPYEWHLNQKYRPARMGANQTIAAFFKGQITETELHAALAQIGYRDSDHDALIAQQRRGVSDNDLSRLVRFGHLTKSEALIKLQEGGFSAENAERLLINDELVRADKRQEEAINILQAQVRDGTLTRPEFYSILDGLSLDERERQDLKNMTELLFLRARKRNSIGQMRQAYIDNIIKLPEWTDFLDEEGYSNDHADILTQQLLKDAQDERDRRARTLSRERHTLTTTLNLGQLRRAFIDGIIALDEWEKRLVGLEYNAEDRFVLTLQVLLDLADEIERKKRQKEREDIRKKKAEDKAAATP